MRCARLLLLPVLWLSGAVAAQAGLGVELHPTASVGAEWVRLADVAAIRGDGQAAARAARLFVGPAPEVGATGELDRTEIERRLRESGLVDTVLSGAPAVRVTRLRPAAVAAAPLPAPAAPAAPATTGATPAEALVTAACNAWFTRQFNRTDLEGEIHLLSIDRPFPEETARVELRDLVAGRLPGRADARCAAFDAEDRALGFHIAKIDGWVSAPVLELRRPCRAGETLAPEDLVASHARLAPGVSYLPPRPELLAGCVAARALRPQTPLSAADLDLPLAVRKGEILHIDSNAGGFRVQSSARALANGRVGEMIPAENPETRRRFLVRATGPGTAEIPEGAR